jgi:hypothetical protein
MTGKSVRKEASEKQPHRSSRNSSGMGRRCKAGRLDHPKAFLGINVRPPAMIRKRPVCPRFPKSGKEESARVRIVLPRMDMEYILTASLNLLDSCAALESIGFIAENPTLSEEYKTGAEFCSVLMHRWDIVSLLHQRV